MGLILKYALCVVTLFTGPVIGQEHITNAACNAATRPAVVNKNKVSLTSPNYPGNYGDNEYCQWILSPGGGTTTMYIHFEDFDTEARYDFVRIYDSNGFLLMVLDGTAPEGESYSFRESEIRIEFDSDGSVTRSGFRINYSAVDLSSRSEIACNPLTLPARISSTNALLQPLGSGDREYCFWIFNAELGSEDDPEGLYIGLNSFRSLQDGQIAVYAGEGRDGEVLFVYNDDLVAPSLLWVRETLVSVEYSSILDVNAYFNITIFPRDGACASGTARQIYMPFGSSSLQSPGYPYILPDYLSCNWVITTDPGQTITVFNAELDLDTDPYCDRDYLEILDGDDALDYSFGRFCNNNSFTYVTSTGSSLQVILRSDQAYEQKKGFNIMFTINGDGDGSGDTGGSGITEGSEVWGPFESNVIKNNIVIDTDISSDEDYLFTFNEDDLFH